MKRLRPGNAAPNFQGELWDGSSFELKSYQGKKTWLAFFRYASSQALSRSPRYAWKKDSGIA